MSLVAQYLFADSVGSPAAIDEISGNNGTVGGDATYDGCSLEVSGSTGSAFASSTDPSLGPETAGALSAWMSWPSADSAWIRDHSGSPPGDNGWLMVTRRSGDTFLNEITYRVGGTEVRTGLTLSFLSTRLTHYAMTWDATGSALYIAGVRVFTGPPPGPTPIVLPWHYGKNGELNQWLGGRIADFRIYDNKLSDANVAALAGEGSPCDTPEGDEPAFGWDVYRIAPPGDSIELIATLNDSYARAIRPVRDEPGSGQLTINRYSPNAAADILAPGNLVKVRIPAIHSDHIFSWFMEQGDFKLVASDEEGGEDITIGGRGALSYWDRAIWLSEKFVVPWWDAGWGTPPTGARGHVTFEAGTYRRYTIAGGVITGYTNFTTAGFEAYFDTRQTYQWPSAASKRFLVHIMTGETHAGWYVHPHQDGVTETLPTYAVGTSTSVLLSDISPDTPGAILYRLFQEGTDPARPTQPIPLMTVDFDDTTDSNGDPWATTDALAGLTAELGETYLDTISKLLSTGVIDVEMGPDLDMHAYNAQGRDLTGTTFGAGKVRFVKGVNIADELRRERDDNPVATFIEVVGTDNAIGRAVLPDAASRVAREIAGTGDSADETVLEAMGLASLSARLIKSDAIGFRIATGDDDAAGRYLPGPEGSDHGDFWLGDITTLHTGTGEQDFDQEDERVFAITIAEDEAGNLEVTPEVGSVLGEAERRLYANDSARTVSFTARSQFTDTEVAERPVVAAADVTVADAGSLFTSEDVEAALQELALKDIGYTAHGNTGSTETFDALTAWHSATLNAATVTASFTGATSGLVASIILELAQDGTGGRLVTWPASVVWPGGVAPTLATAPGATDILTFFSRDGGTTWYGFAAGGGSGGSALTIKDEGSSLATAATSIDFVGAGVVATGTGAGKTVTIAGTPTGSAGGDLSGTYPNPSVVDDSHSHTSATLPAATGTSPADTAGWIPLMDGAGNVVVDGATGQAIMAYGPF